MLAKKGLDGVNELYDARIGIYRGAADIVLDNSHGYAEGLRRMQRLIQYHAGVQGGRTGRIQPSAE